MSLENGTGIQYPEITLGGVTYTVKFTRGSIIYRLNRNGVNLANLGTARAFSTLIDVLHAVICDTFRGTQEDLADLVLSEGKTKEVDTAIAEAIKKAFPPATIAIREPGEARPDHTVQ